MYACNHFDQTQMTTWENKAEAIKNDWTMVKQYFEGLVRNFEVYEQNSGGTAGKNKYESANHAAEVAKVRIDYQGMGIASQLCWQY